MLNKKWTMLISRIIIAVLVFSIILGFTNACANMLTNPAIIVNLSFAC